VNTTVSAELLVHPTLGAIVSNCSTEVADAPRPSLLRVKAASDDTSASGDEIIEDLKGKVRTN
jgi:hypothetical protein